MDAIDEENENMICWEKIRGEEEEEEEEEKG